MQELEEQARMLGGVLTALSAREEALRTARTLDDDLGRLRARAESLQASGHPKAVWPLRHPYPIQYSACIKHYWRSTCAGLIMHCAFPELHDVPMLLGCSTHRRLWLCSSQHFRV